MAKLADAQVLGTCSRKGLEVQILFPAPFGFYLRFVERYDWVHGRDSQGNKL